MKKLFLGLAAFCVAATLAFWLFHSTPKMPRPPFDQASSDPGRAPEAKNRLAPSASAGARASDHAPTEAANSAVPANAPPNAQPPPASPQAASLAEAPPAIPPAIALENMRTTVRQYGLMFGGNPVGTNPEITQALNGENPKQVKFLGPDGNRINGKGELVDAWGTPYFFHQLSAMEMEIRSAGPDKIMWTADDLVIK